MALRASRGSKKHVLHVDDAIVKVLVMSPKREGDDDVEAWEQRTRREYSIQKILGGEEMLISSPFFLHVEDDGSETYRIITDEDMKKCVSVFSEAAKYGPELEAILARIQRSPETVKGSSLHVWFVERANLGALKSYITDHDMPRSVVRRLAFSIAWGMHTAQREHGVWHLDLSSTNVLLTQYYGGRKMHFEAREQQRRLCFEAELGGEECPVAKIIDFEFSSFRQDGEQPEDDYRGYDVMHGNPGLALALEPEHSLMFGAAFQYNNWQAWGNEREFSFRGPHSDAYAFGLMLLEMATADWVRIPGMLPDECLPTWPVGKKYGALGNNILADGAMCGKEANRAYVAFSNKYKEFLIAQRQFTADDLITYDAKRRRTREGDVYVTLAKAILSICIVNELLGNGRCPSNEDWPEASELFDEEASPIPFLKNNTKELPENSVSFFRAMLKHAANVLGSDGMELLRHSLMWNYHERMHFGEQCASKVSKRAMSVAQGGSIVPLKEIGIDSCPALFLSALSHDYFSPLIETCGKPHSRVYVSEVVKPRDYLFPWEHADKMDKESEAPVIEKGVAPYIDSIDAQLGSSNVLSHDYLARKLSLFEEYRWKMMFSSSGN